VTDCILLLSGGIDSTVVLADLKRRKRRPLCLIFDYGQSLQGEIQYAVANARRYDVPHRVVDLPLGWTAPGCALLNDGAAGLAKGRSLNEIAAAGAPPSYVPFRNGVFLALAVAAGEGHGIADIYCGGNGLASGNYPDDTAEFAAAFEAAAEVGTQPAYAPRINFPLATMSKADVVRRAWFLGVELDHTWSCYHDGRHLPMARPCGTCDSCVQREAAIAQARLTPNGASQ
jgi:7-cyano-7-deazaguanine synthase